MIGLLHLTCDVWAWQCQCDAGVLLVRVCMERAWSNNRPDRESLQGSPGPDSHLRTVVEARDGTEFPAHRLFRRQRTIQYP